METPAVATAKAPAWHEALPAPRNTSPGSITRDELLELLKEGNGEVNQRFVLVDVRRADYEVRFGILFHRPTVASVGLGSLVV
jgi:hypothetical protein